MTNLLTFENNGPTLQRTNYFDSLQASKGEFYLTWNSSCARFLVPDNQKHLLSEMKTGKRVIITSIPGGTEIVFDDNSETPFVIQIANKQMDRMLTQSDLGITFQFSVYIRLGEKYAFHGTIE